MFDRGIMRYGGTLTGVVWIFICIDYPGVSAYAIGGIVGMDIAEARRILAERLAHYRTLSYAQLVEKIDQVECEQIGDPGKNFWQLEFQVVWDNQPNGDVRVLGSIDDGGWRAFAPLTDDFIKAPNGEFVGE